MKGLLFTISCILLFNVVVAQVAINTDATTAHGSAMLDIKSNNKGFLPPRMSWTQIQAIQNPAAGLVVFDAGLKALRIYDGTRWVVIGPKEYELTDPPGNYSTFMNSKSTSSGGWEIAMGIDKRIGVLISFHDTLVLGGDMFVSKGLGDIAVASFDSLGNYLWGRSIGSTDWNDPGDIAIDASGNIFFSGQFATTIDLDAGPGVDQHVVSTNTPFFVKYDANGNFIWGKHLTNSASGIINSMALDAVGNIFLSGSFSGTMDADPGLGTQNLISTAGGSSDIFFAKYTTDGNYTLSKRFGGMGGEFRPQILLLDGAIVIAGDFNGTTNLDPAGLAPNLVSTNLDIFMSSYNGSGNFLWGGKIGGANTEAFPFITSDPMGNICLVGTFSGTIDIDPGAGTTNLSSAGGTNDFFIAKYSSSGALLPPAAFTAFKIGGPGAEIAQDVEIDLAGNIFVVGRYESVDFDPGAAMVILNSIGGEDGYVVKYSSTGSLVHVKTMGSSGFDGVNKMAVSPQGKLVFIIGNPGASPWKSFSGERFFGTGFFLTRYEE